MNGEIYSPGKSSKRVVVPALFWVFQSVGRLIFGYLNATTPGGLLDVEVPLLTVQIISLMFFLLGFFGLTAVIGLLKKRRWGVWATITVSILTIIFDIWGLTIQYTAAMGFIVPFISLIYFYFKRSQLMVELQ